MEPSAGTRRSVLVAVNQDPWRLRRSYSTVGAIEALGWDVRVAGPESPTLPARFPHLLIGAKKPGSKLGALQGVVGRNLMRISITVITLMPTSLRLPILARVAVPVLRLRALVEALREDPPSAVVVHDVLLLVAVLHGRKNGSSRVIFDAREFFPKQFEHSLWWRTFIGTGMSRLLRQCLPLCDAVTTVSPGLREGYRQLTGVDPVVVLNVPSRVSAISTRHPVRDVGAPLRLVYHGGVNANRGLSTLIETAAQLEDQAQIDFYLVGPRRLIRTLEAHAAGTANATFHEPVPFSSIPEMLAGYEIGLVFYEDTSFNLRHAMPSKFFEYLHAGLAVAVGPSPDMAAIVREYDCGVVAADFAPEALAAALSGISDERIDEMRTNAALAARELCVEVEYIKLQELLERVAASGDR